VSWSRCGIYFGVVSLLTIRRRRLRVCSAYNWYADVPIDTTPDPWTEEEEGLLWAAHLGRELSQFLGVENEDEIHRSREMP